MSEWIHCQLSDVCDFFIGGTPSRNQPEFWATPPSGSPWLAISDLKSKFLWDSKEHITELGALSSNVKMIPTGSTVMSFKLSIGRVGITRKPMYCNEAIAFFKPHQGSLDSRWLYHATPTAADRVVTDSAVKGATLNKKKIAEIPLHLPPLDEQVGVAKALDTLDTQIQKTEALIAKQEKVKEGLLHDLLTRGIDENGRLRPSPELAPELYKDSPLGLIPREWSVGSLGDLSEIVSGVTLGGKSGSSTWPLVPYLRVANVQDGYLDLTDIKLIKASPTDTEKYRLLPGDVLMNEGGDFDKLGRGALWQGQIELCLHQNHVFRVRTKPSVLKPQFLAAFSSSAMGKRYFIRSSKQSTNLASINSTQLKAFQVPIPSNTEQEIIVEELQAIASKIKSEKALLDKQIIQKSGLMDDLLTGRVRVTPLLKQAQATTPA